MTARELLTDIMEDLENLFADRLFKTPDNRMVPLKTYRQALPKRDAQDEEAPFPYIIVRLDHGGTETPTDPHKVAVLLIIGIYDDALEESREQPPETPEDGELVWDTRNFGYDALLEIIERIQDHYERYPALGDRGQFYFDGPFHWAIQDENAYPYYVGACELEFTLPASRKERNQFT